MTTPPPPESAGSGEIIGQITNTAETIGSQTFSFNNFNTTIITLTPLAQEAGTYHITNGTAKTATITGNTYTISGVPAGTYRLTAEDPTGLYDYVNNEVVVADAEKVTQNIALAVFPGLKLTVKIPKISDYGSSYGANFYLPLRTGKDAAEKTTEAAIAVDLNVDWGDGSPPVQLTRPPGSRMVIDGDTMHTYRDALGSADEKEFVIRIKGTAIVTSAGGGTLGKFGMGYDPAYLGSGTVSGIWHYGNKDKIIKAAGNITALTEGAALTGNAYHAAFFDCRKLADISGLVFTDTGDQGPHFLTQAFQGCAALKTLPASLLPPDLTNTEYFLDRAFKESGVQTIAAGFLPPYTAAGDYFLSSAFEGCADLTIPAGFIPNELARVGNYFLDSTFQFSGVRAVPENFLAHITDAGTWYFLYQTFRETAKLETVGAGFIPIGLTVLPDYALMMTFLGSGVKTIPENFLAHITSAGNNLLANAFNGAKRLETIPAGFLPQHLASAPGQYFLNAAFYESGLREIPRDFIPESYRAFTITNLLTSTFSGCTALTTVDLEFLKNTRSNYIVGNNSYSYMFHNCANLKRVRLPYFITESDLNDMFWKTASGFILDITGGGVLTVPESGYGGPVGTAYTSAAGLGRNVAAVAAVYLDNERLVSAYKAAPYWAVLADKFQVRPANAP